MARIASEKVQLILHSSVWLSPFQIWRGKSSIFGIFYFFTIEEIKMLFKQEKKIADVYGEDVPTVLLCQNWLAKFRSGNFEAEDAPRSGRPVEVDKDKIKALIDANR
ncbi:histone-lysine N-methyltransferase SETMAR [Trichonephila clavipes]|nr:histone-lysine N-methyltransferase SETMAR [Trichonephila clavipes]